jgi:hypothetical protein
MGDNYDDDDQYYADGGAGMTAGEAAFQATLLQTGLEIELFKEAKKANLVVYDGEEAGFEDDAELVHGILPASYDIAFEESMYSDAVVSLMRYHQLGVFHFLWSMVALVLMIVVQYVLVFHQLRKISGVDDPEYVQGAYFPYFNYTEFKNAEFKEVDPTCKPGRTWDDVKDFGADSETMGSMSQGYVFGVAALFLWSCAIIKEFRAIMDFLLILSVDPETQAPDSIKNADPNYRDILYWKDSKGGNHVYSLTCAAKIMIVGLAIYRIVLNVVTAHYGALWLSQTTALEDYILNSLALAFIYDIDEFFFGIVLTKGKQTTVKTMDPITISFEDDSPFKVVETFFTSVDAIMLLLICCLNAFLAHVYLNPHGKSFMCGEFAMACRALSENSPDRVKPFGVCKDGAYTSKAPKEP